jgi:hypothetical protein
MLYVPLLIIARRLSEELNEDDGAFCCRTEVPGAAGRPGAWIAVPLGRVRPLLLAILLPVKPGAFKPAFVIVLFRPTAPPTALLLAPTFRELPGTPLPGAPSRFNPPPSCVAPTFRPLPKPFIAALAPVPSPVLLASALCPCIPPCGICKERHLQSPDRRRSQDRTLHLPIARALPHYHTLL